MHGNEIIYALICNKNHVLSCQYSMLSFNALDVFLFEFSRKEIMLDLDLKSDQERKNTTPKLYQCSNLK